MSNRDLLFSPVKGSGRAHFGFDSAINQRELPMDAAVSVVKPNEVPLSSQPILAKSPHQGKNYYSNGIHNRPCHLTLGGTDI